MLEDTNKLCARRQQRSPVHGPLTGGTNPHEPVVMMMEGKNQYYRCCGQSIWCFKNATNLIIRPQHHLFTRSARRRCYQKVRLESIPCRHCLHAKDDAAHATVISCDGRQLSYMNRRSGSSIALPWLHRKQSPTRLELNSPRECIWT